MAQPSQTPDWNTGGANRVDPPAGQKTTGWTVSQSPPSSFFNWWMFTVKLWVDYLKNLTAEVLTWTAAQIFQAGITVSTGSGTALTVSGTGANPAVTVAHSANDGMTVNIAGSTRSGIIATAPLVALWGIGSGANGTGVYGLGTANGPGVLGQSGAGSAQPGILGRGDSGSSGPGVRGLAGAGANAVGVDGIGDGNGAGVVGTAGVNGAGVIGTGGATQGAGVVGNGGGGALGRGVFGTGGPDGAPGIVGFGGLGVLGAFGGEFASRGDAPGLYAHRLDFATSKPAIRSAGLIDMDLAGAPSTSTALKNLITKQSFAKVTASVVMNNTASPVIAGVQNATVTGTATTITVVFAQPMATTAYQISAQIENPQIGVFLSVASKTTTGFVLNFNTLAVTAGSLSFSGSSGSEANGKVVGILVFGAQ